MRNIQTTTTKRLRIGRINKKKESKQKMADENGHEHLARVQEQAAWQHLLADEKRQMNRKADANHFTCKSRR